MNFVTRQSSTLLFARLEVFEAQPTEAVSSKFIYHIMDKNRMVQIMTRSLPKKQRLHPFYVLSLKEQKEVDEMVLSTN